MRPIKIISGGQSGADKAGLVAARQLGIATGGIAPQGWRICLPDGTDGRDITLAGYGLVEHNSREYPPRTKLNVKNSDGTVWFGYQHSPGGKLTLLTAKRLGKPTIVNPTARSLALWVEEHGIKILNVAGNRTSPDNPDIFDTTVAILLEAFGNDSNNL